MKQTKLDKELFKIINNKKFTLNQKVSIILFGTILGIGMIFIFFFILTYIFTLLLEIEFKTEYTIIVFVIYIIFIKIQKKFK
jgi:hypothetical protein